jgi:transcriptional regulator with XRE-family HTH domain
MVPLFYHLLTNTFLFMAYPKDLRNQLGLSIPTLATLIHCNKSQLSMVEIGKRQLPNHSLAPLTALFNAASRNMATSPAILPNAPATNQWLKRQLRNAKARRQQLLLKQEKLEEQQTTLQHWLGTAALLDVDTLSKGNSTAKLQLQLLNRKAIQKQQQLQLRMVKLQVVMVQLDAVISKAEELMGSNNN